MAERLSQQQGREFEDELLFKLLNQSMANPEFRGQIGSMATPAPEGLAELGPDPDSMSGIMLDIMNLDPTILQDPGLLESLRGQDVLAPPRAPEPPAKVKFPSGGQRMVKPNTGQSIKARSEEEMRKLMESGYEVARG